jgi:hypothetical protein
VRTELGPQHLTDPTGTGRGATLGSQRFLPRSLGDGYGLGASARGAVRRDLAEPIARPDRGVDGRLRAFVSPGYSPSGTRGRPTWRGGERRT